jgi:hypothetical protein
MHANTGPDFRASQELAQRLRSSLLIGYARRGANLAEVAANQPKHQHGVDCNQTETSAQKQGQENPEIEEASRSTLETRVPGLHV